MAKSRTDSMMDAHFPVRPDKPKFRNALDGVERVKVSDFGEGKTVQGFKDECDINNIIKNFTHTGVLPGVEKRAARAVYGDVSKIGDFQECLEVVQLAQEAFATLPASVRERFGNNPGAVIPFIADPANREECVKLGLLEAKPSAEPVPGKASPPSGT